MTMIIDGTNGLTFNNSTVQASAGQVLQVVNNTYSTAVINTGGTETSTGLTASITPKFSTSKILVIPSIQWSLYSGSSINLAGNFTLKRNSTAIYTSAATNEVQGNAQAQISGRWMINLTDSPATTSSTSYTVFFTNSLGNMLVNNAGTTAFITLMEIAA